MTVSREISPIGINLGDRRQLTTRQRKSRAQPWREKRLNKSYVVLLDPLSLIFQAALCLAPAIRMNNTTSWKACHVNLAGNAAAGIGHPNEGLGANPTCTAGRKRGNNYNGCWIELSGQRQIYSEKTPTEPFPSRAAIASFHTDTHFFRSGTSSSAWE